MKNLNFFCGCIAIFIFCFSSKAQTYINKEWVNTTPATNPDFNRTGTITKNGKLYVASNIISGSGTDVLTIAYNQNGDTLWVQTQTGTATDEDNYGTNLTLTPWGDVIVVAAIKNTSSDYDYGIYHYDGGTGALNWMYTWNGGANGIDIPSSVACDDLGNVYVAGGSQSMGGTSDFGILKLSPSGTFLWRTYYDYAGFHDAATNITVKNKIIVTGGSSAGIGDWDIATLNINPNTGVIIGSNRTDVPDATIAEATAMRSDIDNNIYITGFAEVGGDKNIQTIKLDSLLNPLWITNYSGGFDDLSSDLAIDDLGNVYVTGYSNISAEKPKAITIKYSSMGDTLWTKLYGNVITENGAEARSIKIHDDGSIFITGSAKEDGLNSMLLVKYNSEGDLIFSKKHTDPTSQNNGYEMELDSNSVYVTGFTNSGGSNQMSTLRYSIKEKDSSFYRNPTTSLPLYMDRELIVSVHPSLVKTSEIDDLDKQYWEVSDIFAPSLASQIDRSLEGLCKGGKDCPVFVYRIFRSQHSYDTLSISRLGDTVKVPKFWSTFLFEFKEGTDITNASGRLSNLFPSINYVNYNLIGSLDAVPNDPNYEFRQRSLHAGVPEIWDENHINIEPAWDYETGKRHIRVGIIDTPTDWDHEDFGGESETKVDGWDYTVNESIYTADPWIGEAHGTAVAGIVGAISNNDLGIAGIAGGDFSESDDIDSSGVALYGLNMSTRDGDGEVLLIVNHIAESVYNSALNDPDSDAGFGLHIMNNSWGISNKPYYGDPVNPWFLDTNITLIRESFHFANRNNVTVVASRGNSGYMQDAGVYHYNYPGVLDEDWILCVGGTGTDGNYHNGDHPFEYDFKTSQGWEIDVSAASCGSHNWSLREDDEYNVFGGTSAAAPHAAGVAGLLMSYLNEPFDAYDNLAPEDIEYILETTALDVDIVGVDSLTGYGRVDAGAAMAQVDKDDFLLKHFGSDAFPYTPTFNIYSLDDTITFTERYHTDDDVWVLPDHNYIVNTYRVTATVEHSIIDGQEIIGSWERHSSSNLFALFNDDNEIEPRERVQLLSVTDTEAELEGYIYEVKDSTGALISWMPFGPDDPENPFDLCYSLLIKDTVAYAGNDKYDLNSNLKVYPNPTNSIQIIVLSLDQPIDASIRLVDVTGKLIQNVYQGNISEGKTSFEVDLGRLPTGVYFYIVTVDDADVHQYKVIKQ